MTLQWLGHYWKWMIPFLCVVVLFSCTSGKSSPVTRVSDDARKTDIDEKIKKNIEQAVKNGETNININLGDLDIKDEKPDLVQTGDLVDFNFTLSTENGVILKTNVAAEAAKRDIKGAVKPDGLENEIKDEIYSPEPAIVGLGKGSVDISGKLLGLKSGEKKHLVLTPDNGGFSKDPSKIKPFSRFKQIPLIMSLSETDFKNQFGEDPKAGNKITVAPFVTAAVREVKAGQAMIMVEYDGDKEFKDILGVTRIKKVNDFIIIELVPKIGAAFELNSVKGYISSMDATNFYVDFNPPGAGQNLFLDVQILSLVKASQLNKQSIAWVENYKEGLELMKTTGKPMVLFLYKQGCPWCGRMQSEVLQSPLIRTLNRDYVWVKIDSEKNQDIKVMFKQEGFPLIVLMNADQTIYSDLKGFRDARKMRKELRLWNEDLNAGKTLNTYNNAGSTTPDDCRE